MPAARPPQTDQGRAAATSTGTPGGATGTRASASTGRAEGHPGPAAVAHLAGEQRQEEGGEDGVQTERAGVERRHDDPDSGADDPADVLHARVPEQVRPVEAPVARAAMTHEESTTACPSSARRARPPRRDGPTAKPMGTKREFMSAAAPTAAPIPPPAPRIPIAANCALPAKTTADMTTAAHALSPTSTATTPKDSDSTRDAAAYGRPSRAPWAAVLSVTLPDGSAGWAGSGLQGVAHGTSLAALSASSCSGREPATMPQPANRPQAARVVGVDLAQRRAMPHSPSPSAPVQPTGPA
jgi:hypothetical protein